jgi:hypothetical protein
MQVNSINQRKEEICQLYLDRRIFKRRLDDYHQSPMRLGGRHGSQRAEHESGAMPQGV